MSVGLPVDIYSPKRLLFNGIVYGFYTAIFFACYTAAFRIGSPQSSANEFPFAEMVHSFLFVAVVKFFVFNFFNFKRFALYSNTWYDTGKNVFMAAVSWVALSLLQTCTGVFSPATPVTLLMDAALTFVAISLFHSAFRFLYHRGGVARNFFLGREWNTEKTARSIIVGTGAEAQSAYKHIISQNPKEHEVVGFLSANSELIGKQYCGVKVYGPVDHIAKLAATLQATTIIVSTREITTESIASIIDDPAIMVITASQLTSIESATGYSKAITEINLEKMLELGSTPSAAVDLGSFYKSQTVMVTGAAGHVGAEVCRQLIQYNTSEVIALDHSEAHLSQLMESLHSCMSPARITAVVADVTNGNRLINVFEKYRPGVVIHAAAYGSGALTGVSEEEAITNNVLGTKNVADLSCLFKADTFVLLSTNCAEKPATSFDYTKRVSEIYIQGLNSVSDTRCISFRFGRTLDSPGSIIPVIERQIQTGGPVTVPRQKLLLDNTITSTVVHSIMYAITHAQGGETLIFSSGETVPLFDLAKALIQSQGYSTGSKVEIFYTDESESGMGDGITMYDPNALSPTDIPHVSVLDTRSFNWNTVKAGVKEIIDNACLYENHSLARTLMGKLVSDCMDMKQATIPFHFKNIASI